MLSQTPARVIVRESNHHTAAGRSTAGLAARVVGWAYRRADAIVCLSQGVADDCRQRTHVDPRRLRVIYNPIDVEGIRRRVREAIPEPGGRRGDATFEIIGVGRLVEQKGFDLLIEACATLLDVNWRLTIVGDGPRREQLGDLVNRLGLADRVRLPGAQANPYAWIAQADLFVLSSRWEGFGHVIAEAMACGTPVLAARCQSGPDEIIRSDVDGLLCEPNSSRELAEGIRRLANRPGDRARYVREAAQAVWRFDVPRITTEYEAALLDVSDPGGSRSSGRTFTAA
jgi:glycosyltransferase involved in cell wall biosynthesis